MERRDKGAVGFGPFRRPRLSRGVDGHGDDKADVTRLSRLPRTMLAKMDAIGPPSLRQRRRSGKQKHQISGPRRTGEAAQQSPARAGLQAVVAQHDPAAGGQDCGEFGHRHGQALVAEQPNFGERVAPDHRAFYRHAAGARNAPFKGLIMSDAADRLAEVKANIAEAAKRAQRKAGEIRLIAVSKTHEADAIRPLIAAGQRHFGENRVQEAAAKWPALRAEAGDITLHLIGQLQSNKAEEAVELFDAIHSVDRPSLIQALAKACAKAGRRPQMFVQVNVGDEEQKGGCAVADLPALLAEAAEAGLTIDGLMAIPPADVEPAPYFALLDELAERHDLPLRSMGMSGDYETAVMLGATHVRVGTALFGARG